MPGWWPGCGGGGQRSDTAWNLKVEIHPAGLTCGGPHHTPPLGRVPRATVAWMTVSEAAALWPLGWTQQGSPGLCGPRRQPPPWRAWHVGGPWPARGPHLQGGLAPGSWVLLWRGSWLPRKCGRGCRPVRGWGAGTIGKDPSSLHGLPGEVVSPPQTEHPARGCEPPCAVQGGSEGPWPQPPDGPAARSR